MNDRRTGLKMAPRLRHAAILLAFVLLAVATSVPGANARTTGEFSATAKVDTKQGTRSMGFDLVVTNPITIEQAEYLKDVLAQGVIPVGSGRRQASMREGGRGRVSECEESCARVASVSRPPADLDRLGVAGVAHDEVVRRCVGR